MFGKFCLFPVVNSLVILFLIELFVNVLNSKGVLMFKDVRKDSSFKNRSRCCCTLSYLLTKMNNY